MTKYEPGTPSWVDLGTPNPAAASSFYNGLFGWDIQEGPPEAGGYRMCMLDGQPVAGLGPQMNPNMPPFWTTYVTVSDADESAAAITSNGGTVIVEPMDVLDVGRMAVAMDPAGAAFSVWQPRQHIGAGIVNDPNTLCWNELTTRDPQRSVAFYGAVFGWTANIVSGAAPTDYTEFHVNGKAIAGMMPMEGEGWPPDLPNHWAVYFAVEDCQRTLDRVNELGGKVLMGPKEVPAGTFAVVQDPQGAVFSVIALRPTAA
jgi:predicted enzyme related to lactoylglutathione lyase